MTFLEFLSSAPVVAHQGGWDEMLFVAGPLLLIGGVLWAANRRVKAQINDRDNPVADANTTHFDPRYDDGAGNHM